ncbi:MAG TPA: SusC/RagA family TonB-linked outer membrane protein, partial [Chitinophaga sp.]
MMLPITFGKASFRRCFALALSCLLSVTCLNAGASLSAQGITLNEKNVPVEKVFREITRQSGYAFFYVEGLLDHAANITIVVNNATLDKTLAVCFSQLPFTYSIVEKTIVVKEKPPANAPPIPKNDVASPPLAITGRITDANNQALPGATIVERGTHNKTLSREDGSFSLNVSRPDATLVISYIGYQSKEISLSGKASFVIVLQEENKSMNEVVVIGYQSVQRKDLTGTVSSISGAQLEKVPVANAGEALTGRLPGVQVTTVDGQPGAEIVIRVRGGGSITGSNDPLFIVDGFRVSNINDIPASDIASIDILKDAATAAIYGAAGANGVVIVTTKSAKGGKTTIAYNGFAQARQLPRKLEVLSPYEFVLAQYEYARLRSQSDVDNFTRYFGVYDDLELYKSQKGTDWQEELYGSPAWSQQHNISVTGGTDKTKFALGYAFNKEAGLIPVNNYTRNYVSFKLNHEVSRALKLDIAARYTYPVVNGAGSAGNSNFRIGDGITTRPVNGVADMIIIDPGSGEDYEQFLRNLVNPLELTQQDYRRRVNRVLNANAGLSWAITKNITYRTEYSFGLNYGDNRRYFGPLTSTSRNEGGNLPMGEITQTRLEDYRWTNTLAYQLVKGGRHNLNFLVGQEILSRGAGFEEYNRAKYFNDGITPEKLFATMSLGTQDIHTTTEIAPEKTASFFGRLIYQLDDKYILNLTARYDGSTQFAPGKQWGLFPAASLAWRISSEDFMRNAHFISDLKLRASFGAVGNNNIKSDQWRVLFTPSSTRPYGAGDVPNPYYTYASSQLTNPDVKWETTITRNVGLDFDLFNNKISGTL